MDARDNKYRGREDDVAMWSRYWILSRFSAWKIRLQAEFRPQDPLEIKGEHPFCCTSGYRKNPIQNPLILNVKQIGMDSDRVSLLRKFFSNISGLP